jgi:hypothetical protein
VEPVGAGDTLGRPARPEALDNAIRERLGRIEPARLRVVVEVMERLRSDG